MGFSASAAVMKLEEYHALRDQRGNRLSLLDISAISEELMVSMHWLLTGELDKWELSTTAQNVRNGSESSAGDEDWQKAQKALRDASVAYEQVGMERSAQFAWVKLTGSKNAMNKFNKWDAEDSLPDFPGVVEECFGIDVFVLDSEVDFDAFGAMINGSPFIVVKSGVDNATGNTLVAREAAMIISDCLYPSSGVYPEKNPPSAMVGAFVPLLTGVFNTMSLGKEEKETYRGQRFPERLIRTHRKEVQAKKNPGYFLQWMTGEVPPKVEHKPINLDDLAFELGLN
jgi:hypothetical protein